MTSGPPWTLVVPLVEITLPDEVAAQLGWRPGEPEPVEAEWPRSGQPPAAEP